MKIAIIIVGYNRPKALRDLLSSLEHIQTNREVPLIISIDNKGTDEVNLIAENFEWKFGPKEVIIHQQKKGLVKHFIWTGDQTEKYDVVIFLEDDLLASPQIVNYVEQVAEFYKDDDRIAGASLYNPHINEITGGRFYQLEDGYDNYFLQQPYWGHVWFKKPWAEFHKYLGSYKVNRDILPSNIADWEGSFKKIFIQFLIESGKYIVTPRTSLVTNNGVPGIHSGLRECYFQSPIQLEEKKYNFSTLGRSKSKYDSSYEILPEILKQYNNFLTDYDFEVDVNGSKVNVQKEYILTTKPSSNAVMSFSSLMKPTELAVLFNQKGNEGLVLCKTTEVKEQKNYYRTRRFFDIQKNYPVGVVESMLFFKYGVKRLIAVIKGRFFKR